MCLTNRSACRGATSLGRLHAVRSVRGVRIWGRAHNNAASDDAGRGERPGRGVSGTRRRPVTFVTCRAPAPRRPRRLPRATRARRGDGRPRRPDRGADATPPPRIGPHPYAVAPGRACAARTAGWHHPEARRRGGRVGAPDGWTTPPPGAVAHPARGAAPGARQAGPRCGRASPGAGAARGRWCGGRMHRRPARHGTSAPPRPSHDAAAEPWNNGTVGHRPLAPHRPRRCGCARPGD